MTDEANQNPPSRVVKGSGFYTPMDIAPGEAPVANTPPSPPPAAGNSVGLPTTISTPPPASVPPQSGEGSANAESN